MHFPALPALALSALATAVIAQHGAAELGKMGPVAFLWPEDRAWDADHDNTAPCGSAATVGARTRFPITGGAVALTIDETAWDVSIALSVSNDPKSQSEFDKAIHSASAVDSGHQCFKLPALPVDIKENQNATIQLQYLSLDGGSKDTFYACADIVFVAARTFTDTIPCFNVSSAEFTETTSSSSSSSSGTIAAATAAPTNVAGRVHLTAGLAGIALVSAVFGALMM